MTTPIGPTISYGTVNFFNDPETPHLRNKLAVLKGKLDPVVNPGTECEQFWINTAKIVAAVFAVAILGVSVALSAPLVLGATMTTLAEVAAIIALSLSPVTLAGTIASIFFAATVQSHEAYTKENEKRLFDYVTDPKNGVNKLFKDASERWIELFPPEITDPIPVDRDRYTFIEKEIDNTPEFLKKFVADKYLELNPQTT
jgi:hypothetical protein